MVFGGIFAVVGLGLLAAARFAGDVAGYDWRTGTYQALGPVATIVGIVFVALGLLIILLDVVIGRSKSGNRR